MSPSFRKISRLRQVLIAMSNIFSVSKKRAYRGSILFLHRVAELYADPACGCLQESEDNLQATLDFTQQQVTEKEDQLSTVDAQLRQLQSKLKVILNRANVRGNLNGQT